mmetsp:Transcript_12497/g.45573  ORF Transcript_12497/g.45573 Transcript_12497/m.45573 type:complete len:111 (+) Transcript_12497:28-360(+)
MDCFCPTCANLLQVEHKEDNGRLRFFCTTCPYVYDVDRKLSRSVILSKKKEIDDVLGGDDAWKNVDKTQVSCPECNHDFAYFMQLQIRSADEPMSTFYKCCNCKHQWREG